MFALTLTLTEESAASSVGIIGITRWPHFAPLILLPYIQFLWTLQHLRLQQSVPLQLAWYFPRFIVSGGQGFELMYIYLQRCIHKIDNDPEVH